MKSTFLATVFLFFALFFCFRLEAAETIIIDGLNPNWVTVMRFSNYAWREVPDVWLQRDYLPRFKPE